MPIYEYECSNKHRFEVIQRFDEPLVVQCTVCGGPVEKLPSSPAIQFKGSGFYINDYPRKGESSPSESGSESGSGSGSGSEKSSTPSTETASKEKTESPSTKDTKETPSSKS